MPKNPQFLKIFSLPLCLISLYSAQAYSFVVPFDSKAQSLLVMNLSTQTTMAEKNSDALSPLGKMTHLMTALLLFEKTKKGELSNKKPFSVVQPPKNIEHQDLKYIFERNSNVYARDLFHSLVVAADIQAALSLIKGVSNSDSDFIALMNQRAQDLGMKNTRFLNVTGQPEEGHSTTAQDLAILARYIIDEASELYKIYNSPALVLSSGGVPFANDNGFVLQKTGVEGLITGKIGQNNYAALLTAEIDNKKYLFIASGLNSKKDLEDEINAILTWSLSQWRSFEIFKAGTEIVTIPVIGGPELQTPLIVTDDVSVSLTQKQYQNLYISFTHPSLLRAPLEQREQRGTITIGIKDSEKVREIYIPLVTQKKIEKNTFFQNVIRNFYHVIGKKTPFQNIDNFDNFVNQ